MIAAVFAPVAIVLVCLLAWRFWRRLDNRRSPLTVKLHNHPGDYLRQQIALHDDGYAEAAAIAILVGPLFLSSWLLIRISRVIPDWRRVQFGSGDVLLAAMALVVLAWAIWKLIHHASRRRRYMLGLQAERAVAQYLTTVIADGGIVFHDFPADRFNIDHIVIGRSAVFAIETKYKRKPAAKGKDSALVKYAGGRLQFPDGSNSDFIEQARRHADWLTKFLASGVGESVRVVPLLALPGWYVERAQGERPDVLVSNCHNPAFMTGDQFGAPLPESMRRRIAHVLVERYPVIEDRYL